MVRKIVDTKVRTLIKAFLVCNKGKRFTAKEICEFINGGGFALNQSHVHPKTVAYHVNSARYNVGSMLYDVCCEKVHNLNYYWVEV